jgi:hypothetical protein
MPDAPDSLQLRPGQQDLTPAQEVEVTRVVAESIQAQLATEPVEEAEAEALLRHAYRASNLAVPERIHWVDGPLQFAGVLDALTRSKTPGVSDGYHLRRRVEVAFWKRVAALVTPGVLSSVETGVGQPVAWNVWNRVGQRIAASLSPGAGASIVAYHEASWLALAHFYATCLAPNELEALSRFNRLVSGYWLGPAEAILVRRPAVLARDAEGRLHSATGPCVAYPDGWSCYAWHGVQVSAQVILAPETLTRTDFLGAPNLEVRRVIQERMGERFVPALGQIIDVGLRGTLYEVPLSGDDEDEPEQVARYLQVQDASTPRQYFLRVPPWVETAAQAVAWSFRLPVEAYHPTRET